MATNSYATPKPKAGENPADFWGRIAGDQAYNQGQRDFATDQQRFEQGVVGSEREGLSYRGMGQFDSLYQSPGAPTEGNRVTAPGLLPYIDPAAAPPPPGGAALTPINLQNEQQYGVPADEVARQRFYAERAPGQPVAGHPGLVWHHTGSGWAVGPVGGGAPGAPGAPPGGGSSSAPGVTAPGQNPATVPGALSNDQAPGNETSTLGTQDIFRDTLIQLMGQNPVPTLDDPVLKPQAEAFRSSQERARQQRQAAMVERAGAQGLDRSGALDAEIAGSFDEMGDDIALFESQLVASELKDRRAQIMQALSMGGAVLDADLNRRLQTQLAEIDAALKREGFNVQSNLGQGDIALRDKLGTGNLNLGLLGLLMQDKHFGQDLGFRIGSKEADLNSLAMQVLLGGG